MIRVLGDRVLVLVPPSEPETITASGIILTKDPDLRKIPTRGFVVELGEKTNSCDIDEVISLLEEYRVGHHLLLDAIKALGPAPFDVAVGDCVIFAPGDGEEVELDGQTYVILSEYEILGVLDPLPVSEAV